MLFRQLIDQGSSTYTYLLADEQTKDAVLLDPVFEQHARDAALIRELGLTLRTVIDTHCHADHVTGAWLMKQALGAQVASAAVYRARHVDLPLAGGQLIRFGACTLEVRETPGHTEGCLSFVTGDRLMSFTGDSLMVRATGRTDFQGGSARRLYESISSQLFSLPDACLLYPGHDYLGRTSSTIGEEKRHNPRIGGGALVEDFEGTMRNLALPPPKLLDLAVPANLRSGEPEGGSSPRAPAWAPVTITYAGGKELEPEWVAAHLGELEVLDVRSAEEFDGELGHVQEARLIPLDELRARVAEVSGERPVITVCQTGKRSAMAALILEKAGRPRVANLAGGMVRWRALGLP